MSSQSSGSELDKGHELFIEAVKKHEVLYKSDHENYRDKKLRQKAWEQVVAECGISSTVEGAKSRWKYLRDSFAESHKKQVRQHWRYRKQMEFLLPYVVLRRRKYKYLNKGNDVVDLTADEPDLINQNDNSQFMETTLDDEHQSAANDRIAINERQPKHFDLYTEISVITENDDRQKAVDDKNFQLSKDYELYKFFMVMYKEVLKFPDRKKVDVKKRIFKVVTAEEFKTTKESGFRKRSLDVTLNNLPIRKPRRNSSAANTAGASKELPLHSKNKESHCILTNANSSVTNSSNEVSNELNSLPKPSMSSVGTNVLLNQAHVESKSKELELNIMSCTPTVSVTPKESSKTINFPNRLHSDLLQRIGSQISIKVPKTLTMNNTSMFSPPPQSDQSLPKISSAITISPDAFSQGLKIDHSKRQNSELHPIPNIHSLPILNNLNMGTLIISNVPHIEELRDNGFKNNLKSPQAGLSISNNKDKCSNKLKSIETLQNKEVEFSFKNVPLIGVSSTPTSNSISVTPNKKIVDEQNVEKVLNPVDTINLMQTAILSTNFVQILQKNNIKKSDKKDSLRLPVTTCSDVDEIVLSDEN